MIKMKKKEETLSYQESRRFEDTFTDIRFPALSGSSSLYTPYTSSKEPFSFKTPWLFFLQGEKMQPSDAPTLPTLSIDLISQTVTDIPIDLARILEAVEQSRYILELEDDWDDEGSKGYQPLVWERVVIFLIRLSEKALASFNIVLDAPQIYHGYEGSIDLLWRTDKYQLLVNFPEDDDSPGSFYGDNFNIDTFEGTFKPSKVECSLLAFLVWANKCTK